MAPMTRERFPWLRRWLALAVLALILPLNLFVGVRPAAAFTYTVNVTTTADSNNGCATTGTGTCSLRDAVRYANLANSADPSATTLIDLPAGTYTLTQTGGGEDNAATGDLDILAKVTINGPAWVGATVNGNNADRVFDLFAGQSLELNWVKVTNGHPSANSFGGGIRSAGTLAVLYSSVYGNTVSGSGKGGGISASGGLTLYASSIYSNSTETQGGGIYASGTLTAWRSTISGNSSAAVTGGLAFLGSAGTLTFSTVADNTAPFTGGIERGAGTLTLVNTLVADNSGGNCAGTIANGGYNLDSAATCAFGATGGSRSNAFAGLYPLADSIGRGAVNPLHGLRYDSAARDAIPGGVAGCSVPRGGACDIGAAEEVWVSQLTVAAASGPAGGSVALTATLTELAEGLPVAGRTIAFTLNGGAVGSAVTDASGVATLAAASLGGIAPGTYPTGIGASYAPASADNVVGSTGAAALTVTPTTPPPPPPTVLLTVNTVGGGAVGRNPDGGGGGPFTYAPGTLVTLIPQPAAGQSFVGWAVDGAYRGWAGPLTITMDASHTVQATFAPTASFPDVGVGRADAYAIVSLASRGTIRGYLDGTYGPDNGVQRAQMAALIARAMPAGPGTPTGGTLAPPACLVVGTWDCEDWGTAFTDRGGLDANLWRNAGALQHYGVALGYSAADCAARGLAAPCYAPTAPVTYAETITFITRAMIAKGYWVAQPAAPQPYAGVPAVFAQAVATYAYYTGGAGGVPAPPADWNAGATRGWFARALWQALDSYWGTDGTLPDRRPAGGYVP